MHVLFDLDGTLTDPKPGITKCISYALERLGLPTQDEDALSWCIGPPLRESFATILGTDDAQMIEAAIGFYRERFSSVGLYENSVYPGIPEALDELREFDLHVATSKPKVFAVRILFHLGLVQYLKSVNGSELDGRREAKAEVIADAMDLKGIARSEAVMVGDRIHDITGASANGIPCIGVAYGYGSRDELESAVAVCQAPADLPATVRAVFADRHSSAVIPKTSMSNNSPSERTPSL